MASLLLAVWILPSDRRQNLDGPDREPIRALIQKLDVWGIILFALAIIMSLLFLLSLAETIKWWSGLLAVASILVFYVWEDAITDAIYQPAHVSPEHGLHLGTPSVCDGQHNFLLYLLRHADVFARGTPVQPSEHRSHHVVCRRIRRHHGAHRRTLGGTVWIKASVAFGRLLHDDWITLFLVLHNQSPVWWLAINLSVFGFSNGL